MRTGTTIAAAVAALTVGVAAPAAATTQPTPAPTATEAPAAQPDVGRRSGLPFDSGVFAHDAVAEAGNQGRVPAYEKAVGRPVDVWQIAPLRDNGVDALIAETDRIAALVPEDVRVDWATPLMTKEQAARLGTAMCKAGPDPYFRPGWEFNLHGNWDWNTDKIGNEVFAQQFRDTIDGARSTCPGLQATWNPNSGQGGVERAMKAWPGDNYVDVIGLDVYDWSYEEPVTMDGGLNDWAERARAKGKKMSLPEWGAHGVKGRGDNPQFVKDVMGWAEKNADIVVMMSYFDESADYIANSPAAGQMPKVGEALNSEFTRLAGKTPNRAPAAAANPEGTGTPPAPAPTGAATGAVPAGQPHAPVVEDAMSMLMWLWNPLAPRVMQSFRVVVGDDGMVSVEPAVGPAPAPVAPEPEATAAPAPAQEDVGAPAAEVGPRDGRPLPGTDASEATSDGDGVLRDGQPAPEPATSTAGGIGDGRTSEP